VGYPQPTIYPKQLKNSGIQLKMYLRKPKYSGFQPTIYPTTDFLKHLISTTVSGILSVVGIPPTPIPIPEEIQLLMYATIIAIVFKISNIICPIYNRTNLYIKLSMVIFYHHLRIYI
jgi:hypothetical protein